jgi:gliding motility-associated-like protein
VFCYKQSPPSPGCLQGLKGLDLKALFTLLTLLLLSVSLLARPQCITLSSLVVKDENCSQANGSIALVHDGTAPFTYEWSHDANLNDSLATGLAQGSYTVKVTDAANCEAETTLTLTNTPPPTVAPVSFSNPSCRDGSDGGAVISTDASNTVSWNSSPPQSGLVLSNVPAGIFQATITDTFGCTTSFAVNLTDPDPIGLSATTSPDTCGAPNGRARVNVIANAVAPYTYQWDANAGNQTSQTATGLSGGSYTVTVTDAEGCTGSLEVVVNSEENNFGGSVAVTPPSCFGDTDGQVVFSGVGGNGNYSLEWINPDQQVLSTGTVFSNVASGPYQVIVTDPNGEGCEARITFFVNEPAEIKTGYQVVSASDCRVADGAVFVNPTGGTPPYATTWSTGDTGDTLANLLPDLITVTVVDVNGCETSDLIPVTSAPGPIFEVEVLQPDNCGLGEGIVRLDIEVGTAPYEVIWNTNSPQPTDTSLYAFNLNRTGNFGYSVIVIDADSCISRASVSVPGNEPLEVVQTRSVEEYCDLANGEAQVVFAGGTLPYAYDWTAFPPQNTETATGLVAGTYEVTVRDALNCSLTTEVVVEREAGFDLETSATDESCYGQADGMAEVMVQGGRGALQYEWNTIPVQNRAQAVGLSDGSYNVTVRDAAGCERSDFVVIGSVDRVVADFSVFPDSIAPVSLSQSTFRFDNFSIGADTYFWDFGDGSISDEANPVYTYNDTGSFVVQLIAQNNFGQCADTFSLGPFRIVEDGVIHVPSAFSPNRDGFNDEFFVLGQEVVSYQFQVFGRWGNRVFNSNSLQDRWDGSLPSGGMAPEGVYVYVLEATLIGNQPVRQRGTITLLR